MPPYAVYNTKSSTWVAEAPAEGPVPLFTKERSESWEGAPKLIPAAFMLRSLPNRYSWRAEKTQQAHHSKHRPQRGGSRREGDRRGSIVEDHARKHRDGNYPLGGRHFNIQPRDSPFFHGAQGSRLQMLTHPAVATSPCRKSRAWGPLNTRRAFTDVFPSMALQVQTQLVSAKVFFIVD